MLETTITLNRYGRGNRTDLVRIGIYNDGTGTHEMGNYVYAISLDESEYEFGQLPNIKDMMLDTSIPTAARGRIIGFPRSMGSARLLGEVLTDAWRELQDAGLAMGELTD